MSHVSLACRWRRENDPHIRRCGSEISNLFLDDGLRHVVIPLVDGTIHVHPFADSSRPYNLKGNFGRPILNVKVSPVGRYPRDYVAVQRNLKSIDVICNGALFSTLNCKSGNITGYFWNPVEWCDIFIVHTAGVEFFKLMHLKGTFKSVKTINQPTSCFAYSYGHRLLLLPCGATGGGSAVAGYKFLAGNILKLPKFEVAEQMPQGSASGGSAVAIPSNMHIVKIHNALYCVHMHTQRPQMDIYLLTKEYVVKRMAVDLYSEGARAVSVVDNLLLVHNLHTKVVMIYDVREGSEFPITAPLPLGMELALPTVEEKDECDSFSPEPKPKPSLNEDTAEAGHPDESLQCGTLKTSLSKLVTSEERDRSGTASSTTSTATAGDIYRSSWIFKEPHFVMDPKRGELWEVTIDTSDIVDSFGCNVELVEFLLHRKDSKHLQVRVLHHAVQTKMPLPALSRMFVVLYTPQEKEVPVLVTSQKSSKLRSWLDPAAKMRDTLVAASPAAYSSPVSSSNYHHAAAQAQTHSNSLAEQSPIVGLDGKRSSLSIVQTTVSLIQKGVKKDRSDDKAGTSSPSRHLLSISEPSLSASAVSQADVYFGVFDALLTEDPSLKTDEYFLSAVTEYIRMCNMASKIIEPDFCMLFMELMAAQKLYYQLHQCIQYHVIGDSVKVAAKLLLLVDDYPPAHQLALDMLTRQNAYDLVINVLLKKKQVLEAVRFSESRRLAQLPVRLFLDVAKESEDPMLLFNVFRFFENECERNPEYRAVLNEFSMAQ